MPWCDVGARTGIVQTGWRMVSDIVVAVLHGRSPCVPNQLRLFGGACGGKRVEGRFVQHGERVCEIVGGRDDTEIIGRKEFFGAGGAKRGKHKEKFLSSKGIEVWIVPSTDFLHHRRALSALSTVHLSYEGRRREGRCAVEKHVPAERFNGVKTNGRPWP